VVALVQEFIGAHTDSQSDGLTSANQGPL
jgi:hypothetical protein